MVAFLEGGDAALDAARAASDAASKSRGSHELPSNCCRAVTKDGCDKLRPLTSRHNNGPSSVRSPRSEHSLTRSRGGWVEEPNAKHLSHLTLR
jgi:hypothetical protein